MFFSCLVVLLLLLTGSGTCASDLHVIKVQKGDTLLDLCHRYLESPGQCQRVARLNRLRNPDLIVPGQELVMPAELLRSAPVAGLVRFIKGSVVQESPGQGERQPLLLNAPVQQGMRIYTGKEGSVEIVYDDDTSFYLRPETSLSVLRSRKRVDSGIVREFFLHTGEIINRIRRATGQEQRYNIRTPSAIAATRGTVYRVAVDPAETTRSGVLQGKIGVTAMQETVTVREGEGTVVSKGSLPLPPRRLLPPPVPSQLQQSYRSDSFQIRFTATEEAAAVRVMLTRDAGTKDVVREGVMKPGDPFTVTDIADGVYWMQALTIDKVGLEGVFSTPVPVEVRANPLPPNIQHPADGSTFTDGEVPFQWLKVGDAAKYHLQIARDKEFSDRVVDLSRAEVSAVAKGLGIGNFFFRLSSVAADGYQGEWTDTLSFKVTPPPPPPPAPSLETPVSDKMEMRIRVREPFPGLSYHFQVAKEPQFTTLLLDETRDGPELVFPRPEKPGVYHVRSRCGDSTGKYGAFSGPQTFEIKSSFPYGFVGAGLGAVGVALLLLL